MAYNIPAACPVCAGKFSAVRLRCEKCAVTLEGEFAPDRFSGLTDAQRDFVISFLRSRGNIREMEKEYSISYPTVRARIDEIVTALGEKPSAAGEEMPTSDVMENRETRKTFRREVLDKLASGEIDAKTAQRLMERT